MVTRVLPETISVDSGYLRPYTDELTGGFDHELLPALRLSLALTHRVERNPQATSNPANPFDTFLTTRVDTAATALPDVDDSTFQFYNRTSAAVTDRFQRPQLRQTYDASRLRAPSACRTVADAAGDTYSETASRLSITPTERVDQCAGPVPSDRLSAAPLR